MPFFSNTGQLSVTLPANVGVTAAIGASLTLARADHVHDIDANAVEETSIATDAVTTAKIKNLAVTEAKLSQAMQDKIAVAYIRGVGGV